MKPAAELLPHSDYLKVLKPRLPREAFARNPRKLFFIGLQLFVVFTGYTLMRRIEPWYLLLPTCLCIGHSIACLGFYAHDLSHKTILRDGLLLRIVETLVWTVVAVPATMWKRVHNATHHVETNTVRDPDRWFLVSEKAPVTNLYTQVFYPHRDGVKWNPLVGIHFLAYVIRNVQAALGSADAKPTVVPAKPKYTLRQRLALCLELLLFVVYQVALFRYLDGDLRKFLWASPFVYCVTSTVVMAYIFTNHSINPLCEHTDPVAGTTSVGVPKLIDVLHTHFSHHTEHHLFPGMDSSHYPEVARLLRQYFPERYNRLSMQEAWRRLWRTEGFLE
jgi:fatty acid desaturase